MLPLILYFSFAKAMLLSVQFQITIGICSVKLKLIYFCILYFIPIVKDSAKAKPVYINRIIII
jgi:hypothetical protein